MPRRLFKKRKGFSGVRRQDLASHVVQVEEHPENVPIEAEDPLEGPSGISTPGSLSVSSVSSARASSASSSLSSQKLKIDQYDSYECSNMNDIFESKTLFDFIAKHVVCKSCHEPVIIEVSRRVGLAAEVLIACSSCKERVSAMNSQQVIHTDENGKKSKVYDVNLRMVYGMRSIGCGYNGSKLFCGLMNLPAPHSRPKFHEKVVAAAVERVAKQSMQRAAREAIEIEGSKDIKVALDGTWQKRGHTSLNGVVSCTSIDNGKVLDVSIMSKYCMCRGRLSNNHEDNCTANYMGTSGGMEAEGAKQIFLSSLEKYGVRYTHYLGDGDSKGFRAVVEAAPYGQDIQIEKLECIGHIQKRMGTRLRKLKAAYGSKKLKDGKSLAGKGRLTDKVIDKLQIYYGLAIRRSEGSSTTMKTNIWAQYFHLLSSNENPTHGLCSADWCKYKKAQEEKQLYDHSAHLHLPEAVMEVIKPIFKELSKPELLQKCTHGKTQNLNESFNNIIWERIPKTKFVQLDTLKFGVNDAICAFNDGFVSRCKVFMALGISPGYFFVKSMKAFDKARKYFADRAFDTVQAKASSIGNVLGYLFAPIRLSDHAIVFEYQFRP